MVRLGVVSNLGDTMAESVSFFRCVVIGRVFRNRVNDNVRLVGF